MEENPTPPPVNGDTDGSSDTELLRAISANSECAHVLAAIAAGGDPVELLATLLPKDPEPAPAPEADRTTPDPTPVAEHPEIAMYQSAAQAQRQNDGDDRSYPTFLANIRPDFWDGF